MATGGGWVADLDTKKLDDLIKNMDREADAALDNAADQFVQKAKQEVPVDTGALQRSIHVRDDHEEGERVISDGPARDGRLYGKFQEFGTSKMAAQPFFIPAREWTKPLLLNLLGKIFQR